MSLKIDVRTGQTVSKKEPTEEERIAVLRKRATLSRADFFESVMDAGLVTAVEAKQGASGNGIPTAFSDAIAGLPEVDRDKAQVRFYAASEFRRLHPLVIMVQEHMALTDAEVDEIFGIEVADI